MNNLLGTGETLALLHQLKGGLENFAAREARLEQDFQTHTAAQTHVLEAAAQKTLSRLSDRIDQEEEAHAAEQQRLLQRHESRRARLGQLINAFREKTLAAITGQEGQRKHKNQSDSMKAERQRDTELAAAVTAREEFEHRLAESGSALSLLERATASAFGGSGSLRRLLAPDRPWPEFEIAADEQLALAELNRLQAATRDDLARFKKIFLPQFFRRLPLWLWLVLGLGGSAALVLLHQRQTGTVPLPLAAAPLGLLAAMVILHQLGRRQAAPLAGTIAANLARARRLYDAGFALAETRLLQEQQRIKSAFENTTQQLHAGWRQLVKDSLLERSRRSDEITDQSARILQKQDASYRNTMAQVQTRHPALLLRMRAEAEAQNRQLAEAHAAKLAKLTADHKAGWQALEADWQDTIPPIFNTLQALEATTAEQFPDWRQPVWKDRALPEKFLGAAPFARLDVAVRQLAAALPKDARLAIPAPTLSTPLLLKYPEQGSVLFETHQTGGDEAVAAINNIIFRLLSSCPAGRLSFTIFDPVGLGQNFAGLMHLADFEECHINSRIWTQAGQFEEKLAELNEHMEKVIQMYLRNEYATIAEYNARAGVIAEKYHVLVIASFPVNFSDTAVRRLLNIAASGARCGVYTLIHWDHRHASPPNFVPDELRKNSVCVAGAEKGLAIAGPRLPGAGLVLDPPPAPEFVTEFLRTVGRSGRDSNRVEVPFSQVAPPDAQIWTEEATEELRVPIGRSGATKLQYLALGKATRQHALVAGKTGSGKSTLFHVIITNLALWCSPEQVEFYLVDFKKGVEFKCYASRQLPHARVVAIESDRAFGLSVLQRVDEELRRRGDLFRQAGAQNLAGYKRAGGKPLPRTLLLIDEFQEFFVEEDAVAQSAAMLLDRLVRQGRAFGIHVLLGSQTLGGAYTLARATIGQMVVRIALQCNEADAYLIMDQDNPAPRLLTRPGEGIYNDTAGAIEGNSPFQTVWLADEERDRQLEKIRARAAQSSTPPPAPFVFEGNAPADVRSNLLLRALLQANAVKAAVPPRIWLGAPNAIKGPTEASFPRRSGSHLLMVGQADETTHALASIALASLAAQFAKGAARFVLLDSTPPEFPQRELLARVLAALPHPVIQVNHANLANVLSQLMAELTPRDEDAGSGGPGPETFVFIHGLQNFKQLRQEDEFSFSPGEAGEANPAALLRTLISEGPKAGMHVIAACDTYANVTRSLGRKLTGEFGWRVLFQMGASDSASLIDDPAASTLGLHRALLHNEREGSTEIFRPYTLPDSEWAAAVAAGLQRLFS